MTFEVKIREKTGKCSAEEFALKRHGAQIHGSIKICDHLADVAKHVEKHYDPSINISDIETIISAAWLHDCVEDTNTSSDEICERFGDRVGNIVDLVTDKRGKNRLECHLRTYHAIRTDPDATLVKLADRRHNQHRSLVYGERFLVMYEREYTYFKFALWAPHKFADLWGELDLQHEEMKRALSW